MFENNHVGCARASMGGRNSLSWCIYRACYKVQAKSR